MKTTEIQKLLEWITKSGLQEVNIETEDVKLHIKRNLLAQNETIASPNTAFIPTPSYETEISSSSDTNVTNTEKYITIKSPMIGTFYRSMSPDSPPFITEGSRIEPGSKLCVIEAMKLYNEIEAEISGTIVQILLDNASPVDYDQPLFVVDPS